MLTPICLGAFRQTSGVSGIGQQVVERAGILVRVILPVKSKLSMIVCRLETNRYE